MVGEKAAYRLFIPRLFKPVIESKCRFKCAVDALEALRQWCTCSSSTAHHLTSAAYYWLASCS